MATYERFPMMFTAKDREPFNGWLDRCIKLGLATTMTDAIRLAVRLAETKTDEQIKGSTNAA